MHATQECFGAGVTLITHGYGGNADGWVSAMADEIPNYYSFPGTNFTTYDIALTTDGTTISYQLLSTNGSPALST